RPEQDRRERDRALIDQPRIEVLADRLGAAADADVSIPGHLAGLPQRGLDAVVDEVEGGPTRALPWLAYLVGEDEDRRVERRVLGPPHFAALEHALADDGDAGAVERLLEDLVVRARLAALAKVQVLAEESLREHPALELHPLGASFVLGAPDVAPVLRSDEPVEGHRDAKEHLAHGE